MNKEPNGRAPVERRVIHKFLENKMKQWLKEVFHNCICHPLIPFLPRDFAYRWHERNGKWTYGDDV